MINIYPSGAMLHREELAAELMREQAEDTTAFVAGVRALLKILDSRAFCLGSPVIGYDIKDIEGHCGDWLNLRDEDYEEEALDMVRRHE